MTVQLVCELIGMENKILFHMIDYIFITSIVSHIA